MGFFKGVFKCLRMCKSGCKFVLESSNDCSHVSMIFLNCLYYPGKSRDFFVYEPQVYRRN